jgi:hypothetical protein
MLTMEDSKVQLCHGVIQSIVAFWQVAFGTLNELLGTTHQVVLGPEIGIVRCRKGSMAVRTRHLLAEISNTNF